MSEWESLAPKDTEKRVAIRDRSRTTRMIPCYSKDHRVAVNEDRVRSSIAARKTGSTTPRQ